MFNMKFWGFLFFMIALCIANAQSFTEDIEVKQIVSRASNLTEYLNLDLTTNKPLDPRKTIEFTLLPQRIQLDTASPFISVSAGWYETNGKGGNTLLSIRFSVNTTAWEGWQDFKIYDHFEKGRFTETSGQIYIDKKNKYYQLKIKSNLNHAGENVHALLLNFYNPDKELQTCSNSLTTNHPRRANTAANCLCFIPPYISRPDWNCLEKHTSQTSKDFTHIIIHHSGGPNISADWNATVLSIWNTSTITYGFKDIGFNWLIAPDGVIYEGRSFGGIESNGDHFCDADAQTIGICMLGTYQDQDITDKARNSLIQLLAWKSCQWNINSDEKTMLVSIGRPLDNIDGHLQGCTVDCPGEQLFKGIPALRIAVKNKLKPSCLSTGIRGIFDPFNIQVSPNPFSDHIAISGNLTTATMVQIQVTRVDGRLVYQTLKKLNTGRFEESLPDLSLPGSGVYLMNMRIGQEWIIRKLVKL